MPPRRPWYRRPSLLAGGAVLILLGCILWSELSRYQGALLELFPEDCFTFLVVDRYSAHDQRMFAHPAVESVLASQIWQEFAAMPVGALVTQSIRDRQKGIIPAEYESLRKLLGEQAVWGIFPGPNTRQPYNFAFASRLRRKDRIGYDLTSLLGMSHLPPGKQQHIEVGGRYVQVTTYSFGESGSQLAVAVQRGMVLMATDTRLLERMIGNFSRVSTDRLTRKALLRELFPSGVRTDGSFMTACAFELPRLLAYSGREKLLDAWPIKGFVATFDLSEHYEVRARIVQNLPLPRKSAKGPEVDSRQHRTQVRLAPGDFCYGEAGLWWWLCALWQIPGGQLYEPAVRETLGQLSNRVAWSAGNLHGLPESLVLRGSIAPPADGYSAVQSITESYLKLSGQVPQAGTALFREGQCPSGQSYRGCVLPEWPAHHAVTAGELLMSPDESALCYALSAEQDAESWLARMIAREGKGGDDFVLWCDWAGFLLALQRQRALPSWADESQREFWETLPKLDFLAGWRISGTVEAQVMQLNADVYFR